MNTNNDRIEYIDIAKGLGILLVIIGHIIWGDNYKMPGYETICNFIYSFHMPLFFVISGLCIKESKELTKETFLKMIRAYLFPYAVWTLIYMAVFTALELPTGQKGLLIYQLAHAISICGLAPLWFLLALFIAESFVIRFKNLISTKSAACAALILCAAVSITLSFWYESVKDGMDLFLKNWLMGLFRIFPTTFFIIAGYKSRNILKKIIKIKSGIRIVMIVLMSAIQVLLCYFFNEGIDVQLFQLGNQWLYFIKALNGTAILLMVSGMIHSKLLSHIGRHSKELMILHHPPFFFISSLSLLLSKLFSPNIFGALIITAATTLFCLAIDQIMGRFRPYRFSMGKKKLNN